MPLNAAQITEGLATGNFGPFIGEIENHCFDAKGKPYVDTDAGKRELARDVSAFANADGGYILIGLKTTASTLHHADQVEALHLLPQGLVNTLQMRNIVNDWVYPAIEGLTIAFYPSNADSTRGIVAVYVPAQRRELRPFLIKRSFDGARYVETMFGYVERKGDANSPLTVFDLQRALRSGLHFEEQLTSRLDRIEALVAAKEESGSQPSNTDEVLSLLNERIQRALQGGSGGTA